MSLTGIRSSCTGFASCAAVKTPYEETFVELAGGERIRTLVFNAGNQSAVPLVLVHGFGAAVGCWVKNLDKLASRGPLYVVDQLGFGRSSRPKFAKDAEGAEEQLVNALHMWREAIGLDQMILLGHSLGGYVCFCYALKYPQHIKHLILADPFGMRERPAEAEDISGLPFKYRIAGSIVQKFNIFSLLRAAGPLGTCLC